MVIHGGDFFDRMPNLEEIAVFMEYVAGMPKDIPIVMIDGNHEAARKKATSWLHLLSNAAANIHPSFSIVEQPRTISGIDFLPYKDLKITDPEGFKSSNILVTHVRGEIPPHVHPEVDLAMFDSWDYVLAGDLHSHKNSQRNILYPGSPMNTSFSRNKPKGSHGVIIMETDEPEKYEWVEMGLPYLLRKEVKVGEETEQEPPHYTVFEFSGSFEELATIQKSDGVEKRVHDVETETLLFQGAESYEEELDRYLKEIMKVADTSKHLGIYRDHIA